MDNAQKCAEAWVNRDLQVLKGLGFTPTQQKVDERISEIRECLLATVEGGLDIGTIIKCVVSVKIVEHPEHGWGLDGGKHGFYGYGEAMRLLRL